MKTSLDILQELYQLVNMEAVTDLIDGAIYIGTPPDGDERTNIALNVINNRAGYLQEGYANVNIYTKALSKGRPNTLDLQPIVRAVTDILEDARVGRYFFQVDDDKGLFKDPDRDGIHYYNLRIEFQTL